MTKTSPNRDFGKDIDREIRKVDKRIAELLAKRTKFVRAFRSITQDYSSLVKPDWLDDFLATISELEVEGARCAEEDARWAEEDASGLASRPPVRDLLFPRQTAPLSPEADSE